MIETLSRELSKSGLLLRGGFRPVAEDEVPLAADQRPTRTVLMVGNAGPAMWRRFSAERPDGPDPLDAWCALRLGEVADHFGARAVFPFQRPYLPFQRWLARAEPCHASPLGIFIHPRYGLWHAVRGALLLAEDIDPPQPEPGDAPCAACPGRPCLTACPVGAFSVHGYDVPGCADHLRRPTGADCMELGCRARRACPVGASYRYHPRQAGFHMAAFLTGISGGARRD